jgi:hypothetical protein
MPAITHHALDTVKLSATSEQLTIELERRHSGSEPIRRIQHLALPRHEVRAIPAESPAVELLAEQPARDILSSPVFKQREFHAENLALD